MDHSFTLSFTSANRKQTGILSENVNFVLGIKDYPQIIF